MSKDTMDSVRAGLEDIYRELFDQFKGSIKAVSSESLAHKNLRFKKIAELFEGDESVQVHDVGMGLADFHYFLKTNFSDKKIDYSGSDILDKFIVESKKRFPECEFFKRDLAKRSYGDRYDYLILSGVFHQRSNIKIPDFEKFSQNIIKNSFDMCKKGIAFNFVSPFVDYYQTNTYYCNIIKLINFINDELSRFFSISNDYALFEFTVHVYREEFIMHKYPQSEFQKYFSRNINHVKYV